jgi:hypothetical protein
MIYVAQFSICAMVTAEQRWEDPKKSELDRLGSRIVNETRICKSSSYAWPGCSATNTSALITHNTAV